MRERRSAEQADVLVFDHLAALADRRLNRTLGRREPLFTLHAREYTPYMCAITQTRRIISSTLAAPVLSELISRRQDLNAKHLLVPSAGFTT